MWAWFLSARKSSPFPYVLLPQQTGHLSPISIYLQHRKPTILASDLFWTTSFLYHDLKLPDCSDMHTSLPEATPTSLKWARLSPTFFYSLCMQVFSVAALNFPNKPCFHPWNTWVRSFTAPFLTHYTCMCVWVGMCVCEWRSPGRSKLLEIGTEFIPVVIHPMWMSGIELLSSVTAVRALNQASWSHKL